MYYFVYFGFNAAAVGSVDASQVILRMELSALQ